MKHLSLALLGFLVIASSTCSALSQDLQVHGFNSSREAFGGWDISVDDPAYAAVRYTPEDGEVAVLLVHTSIDPGFSNPNSVAGLLEAYPFLRAPLASWDTAGVLSPSIPGVTYSGQHVATVVPPDRIRTHLLRAVDPQNNLVDFGPVSSTSGLPVIYGPPTGWDSVSIVDERYPLSHLGNWRTSTIPLGTDIFDVSAVGRAAVYTAAQIAAGSTELDPNGVEGLNDLLSREIGFLVNLQVLYIKPLPSGPKRIRMSQPIVLRKRSLFDIGGDPWWVAFGAQMVAPSLTNANDWVHFVPRGLDLVVPFDSTITDATAYVETPNGLVAVPQAVRTQAVEFLYDNVARFPFPLDGYSGMVYFSVDDPVTGPTIVLPQYHYNGGALIWAFQPVVQTGQ